MGIRRLWVNVFEAGLARLREVYGAVDTVVVSFSAGKDSGVCLELATIVARETGRLPVNVVMRDEEIMFPGTFEYAERVAARPEVDFRWFIAHQPIINVFDRTNPYWWVFDERLPPEEWVRTPPAFAEFIEDNNIEALVTPERFPVAEGRRLIDVIGLRAQESVRRKLGLHSSGGFLTKRNKFGLHKCRPIYDWTDSDVWLAHRRFGWDYNKAYDVMHRMGVKRHVLRIAPPTMSTAGLPNLQKAAQAWPRWFERVCRRLPGIRAAALFGKRAVTPSQRPGETWRQCFVRVCIEEAPDWIAERASKTSEIYLTRHRTHSTLPFPDVKACTHCPGGRSVASWKQLTHALWNGDPFSLKVSGAGVPQVEPEFFRDGAGVWGGQPSW